MQKIILIYSTTPEGVIGIKKPDGTYDQPFHSKKDFKHFKKTTKDNIVVMGRNTYEAIGKPLEDRINIVLSNNPHYYPTNISLEDPTHLRVAMSINGVIASMLELEDITDTVYVIGGAKVLKQFENLADGIIVTNYDQQVEVTEDSIVYLPDLTPFKYIEGKRYTDIDSVTGQELTFEVNCYWRRH